MHQGRQAEQVVAAVGSADNTHAADRILCCGVHLQRSWRSSRLHRGGLLCFRSRIRGLKEACNVDIRLQYSGG